MLGTPRGRVPPASIPRRRQAAARSRGRRLPALQPDRRHPRSSRILYPTICREWTFYSHPAIVDVDHGICHFPEHRKVALLADDPPPRFNAFTIRPATYALGLFIASAVFDGDPALRRSGTSACLDSVRPTPSRSRSTTAPRARAMARPLRPAARRASTPSRAAHHDFDRVLIRDGLGPLAGTGPARVCTRVSPIPTPAGDDQQERGVRLPPSRQRSRLGAPAQPSARCGDGRN